MKYIIILVVLLAPLIGFSKKKVVYRRTQEVNFDETSIDGKSRSPDGSYLHQKRGVKFLPLYKVRKEVDDNIKSSVEYLR